MKLNPSLFQKICKYRRTPEIDVSCFPNLTPVTHLHIMKTGTLRDERCFPNFLDQHEGICLSPILSNRSGRKKDSIGPSNTNSSYPRMGTQSWYPQLLQMSIKDPLLFQSIQNLLIGPKTKNHQLIRKQNLQLLALSGKSYLQRDYQKSLQPLFQIPYDQVKSLITNRPGLSGIDCVVGAKLIQIDVLWGMWCNFSRCFQEGLKNNTIAGFRSAISVYHDPIQSISVGKHPRVLINWQVSLTKSPITKV